jgi:intein-encoded DNA endonuclease-like protein
VRAGAARRFTETQLRDLYERQHLSTRVIGQLHGCSKSTVVAAMLAYGIRPRPPRLEPVYPRQSFSGNPLEKAYLIGFRDGDLHVHKANHHDTSRTIVVACASSKQEQIDLIRGLFEPYGRVTVSSTPKQSVVTCWLNLSFSFLLQKSAQVPDWILDDLNCFPSYLAGYVDAEGYIGVKRATNSSQLVLRSGDLGILQCCRAKLIELGVDCPPINLVRSAGERDGSAGPVYRRDYWCLAVYRQASLDRLFAMISPFMRHAKRRRDLMQAWENVRVRLAERSEIA